MPLSTVASRSVSVKSVPATSAPDKSWNSPLNRRTRLLTYP